MVMMRSAARASRPSVGGALSCTALAVLLALLSPGSFGQTPAARAEGEEPPPVDEEAWALVEDARSEGAPGPEHARLEPLVGRWLVEAIMAVSLEERIEVSGTAENRWVMGGRYLRSESSLGGGSTWLHFLTFFGYSSGAGRFFALDLNDIQASPGLAWGAYNHSSRSLLLTQRDRDRHTNTTRVRRRILTIRGLDSYTLEVFLDPAGASPVRTMRASFTRDLGEPP